MARLLRNIVTDETKAKSEWKEPKFIAITELPATTSRARIQEPARLVFIGSDEPTPYTKDTPEALLAYAQRVSKEADLPIGMYAIKSPPKGEPRLEKPVVRFNRFGPYLSYFPGRAERPKADRPTIQRRVWK